MSGLTTVSTLIAALAVLFQEHILSDAVACKPLPTPSPVRTIAVLTGSFAVIWAVSTKVPPKEKNDVQWNLITHQEAMWMSQLEETERLWGLRLDELKEQLEESYQEKLLNQLRMKDAEAAVKMVRKEEEVKRELEHKYRQEVETARKMESARVAHVEKIAELSLAKEREYAKEVWRLWKEYDSSGLFCYALT